MEFYKKTTNVKSLKAEAKRRGFKRYSHLKKAKLIQLLLFVNIMDEPVPNIGQPPLKSQPFKRKAKEKVRDLG